MGKTFVKKNILLFMLVTFIFAALLFSCPWGAFANATVSNNVKVIVDGKNIAFDSQPYINKDLRTMVPIRFVAEELGATVNWDNKNKSVQILMRNKTIYLYIGKTTGVINGSKYTLDTKPELKNGRTMVPLRFISEALGAKVEWDNASKTVRVTTGSASDKDISVIGKTIKVTANTLNVRENPGVEYRVLGKVTAGDKFIIQNSAEDKNKRKWYEIKLPTGNTGWIASWYVEFVSGEDETEKNYDNYEKISERGVVTGSTVNIRKEPDASKDNIIAQVKNGDVLDIIGKLNNWYKVRLADNKEGWIYSSLISIRDDNPPSRGDLDDNLTKISDVSFINNTLTIKGDASLRYNIFTLQNPLRLVIDLPGTLVTIDSNKLDFTVNSSFAQRVRIAQFTEDTTRIVIDLKKPVDYDVQKYSRDKEISLKLEERSIKGKLIVLDPGHGVLKNGKYFDPGAVGPTGVREVDVVLEIAKKTEQFLTAKGANVVMTRTSSKANLTPAENAKLTLTGRATTANNLNADIFVSIHANASTNRSVKGTSVYYHGTSSQQMRAERQRLARAIQKSVVKEAGTRDIGIIEANFTVLTHTKMPSVLVETAFISNPEEEILLTTDEFQTKIARGIAEGIENYFTE